MRFRELAAAAIAVMAIAGVGSSGFGRIRRDIPSPQPVRPTRATTTCRSRAPSLSWTMPRGRISMCFPDNKDNKVVVVCTPATKLP